jgi:hypothetical protein
VAEALAELGAAVTETEGAAVTVTAEDPRVAWAVAVAAYACGWQVAARSGGDIRLLPRLT